MPGCLFQATVASSGDCAFEVPFLGEYLDIESGQRCVSAAILWRKQRTTLSDQKDEVWCSLDPI